MKKVLLFISTVLFIGGAYAQDCIPNTSSIQFSGSGTYVDMQSNNGLDISDSLTIEAWVYSTAWGITSAQNSIVCKHGWSIGEGGYVLRAGGTGELSFNIAGDSMGTAVGWKEVISSTGVISLNAWHHVAGEFDGNELRVYVDGILVGTTAFSNPISIAGASNYSLKIGKLADDSQPETRYWNGRIDEVRIWHRILSTTELTQNMMQHIDTTGGVANLSGYWRFNENTGSTVYDMGSGNNMGAITNGTWSTNVPFNNSPTTPVIGITMSNLFSSALSGNQWYLDSNLIPGATGIVYQPLVNGSYTVVVTSSNGCSATSAAYILTTVNVDQLSNKHVLLQSGEINDRLQFALPESTLSSSELKIYDTTGKLLVDLGKGQVTKQVPLNIKSGMYFLYLSTMTNRYTEKILVH